MEHRLHPDRKGIASIYQPKLDMGLTISFNAEELDGFSEWKMMGWDYVLGLSVETVIRMDGKRSKINYYEFLMSGEQAEYNAAIERIVPSVDLEKIARFIKQ